jgi:hypothetical protein
MFKDPEHIPILNRAMSSNKDRILTTITIDMTLVVCCAKSGSNWEEIGSWCNPYPCRVHSALFPLRRCFSSQEMRLSRKQHGMIEANTEEAHDECSRPP